MEATKTSNFQKALEAVAGLSIEDQGILLDILHKRLQQQQRHQLVKEIQEVRQEYTEGNARFGSVDDFLAELDD